MHAYIIHLIKLFIIKMLKKTQMLLIEKGIPCKYESPT